MEKDQHMKCCVVQRPQRVVRRRCTLSLHRRPRLSEQRRKEIEETHLVPGCPICLSWTWVEGCVNCGPQSQFQRGAHARASWVDQLHG